MGDLTSIMVSPPLANSVENQEPGTICNLTDVPLVAVGDIGRLRAGVRMAIPLHTRKVAVAEQRNSRHRPQRRTRCTIADEAVLAPNVGQVVLLPLLGGILHRGTDQERLHIEETRQHVGRNRIAARVLHPIQNRRVVHKRIKDLLPHDDQVRLAKRLGEHARFAVLDHRKRIGVLIVIPLVAARKRFFKRPFVLVKEDPGGLFLQTNANALLKANHGILIRSKGLIRVVALLIRHRIAESVLHEAVGIASNLVVNLVRRRTGSAPILHHTQMIIRIGRKKIRVLPDRNHRASTLGNEALVANPAAKVGQVLINMGSSSRRHYTPPLSSNLDFPRTPTHDALRTNGPISKISMISPAAEAASNAMPRTTSPPVVLATAWPLVSEPTKEPLAMAPPAITLQVPPIATVTGMPSSAR